jgi:hypothetical protein
LLRLFCDEADELTKQMTKAVRTGRPLFIACAVTLQCLGRRGHGFLVVRKTQIVMAP